jgi:hypothetical protein
MINKDRLGYYRVGFKRFHNKTMAILESYTTGYKLEWIFNDDIYRAIDWTIPIDVPLKELYRIRAQQIRDTYDYICLYFSGGADSSNVLHAFIDNNIFLDEIIMFLPKSDVKNLNNFDKSNRNCFAEIEFEAKRRLKEYRNIIHPDTKIRDFDIAEPVFELLKKDNWFEYNPFDLGTGIGSISREYATFQDFRRLSSLYESKKIAQIIGADKPLVRYDGYDYYCFFSDDNAYHNLPIDHYQQGFLNNCFTELFYWSPDLPEIVVKQAQEIKKNAENNLHIRNMLSEIMNRHIGEYREILHPIIYPLHTEPLFQTEKGKMNSEKRIKENWFWKVADQNLIFNYENTLNYLRSNLNIGNRKEISYQNINIGFYKL